VTDWRAYFKALVKVEELDPVRPAPEVSSRDPWPQTIEIPSAVVKLEQDARKAGWQVDLAYSRGFGTYRSKAWQREEMISVRCHGHPDSLRRAFAVYRRTSGKVAGAWSWQQIYLWGPDLPWFGLCNVTELRDFLDQGGRVPKTWLADVRRRVREAELKAAERPKKPSAKKAEHGG
jgi:hypothetical protein